MHVVSVTSTHPAFPAYYTLFWKMMCVEEHEVG